MMRIGDDRLRSRVMLVMVVFIAVGFLIWACAPAPSPPEVKEEKKVKVGLSLCLTGPIASTGKPFSLGILDYLTYVNDVLGGIEYRTPEGKTEKVKMDIKWEDNAYDPARALAIYKRQSEWGAQIMHLTAGSMVLTCLSHIARDHMPVVYGTVAEIHAMAAEPLTTVAQLTTYVDEHAFFMDWVKAGWKEARPPRIGFINLESPMARAQLPGKGPDYAQKIGVEYLGLEWVPYAVTSAAVELKRLADKGADWIFVGHVSGGASVVLKDAERLGLKNKVKFALVDYGSGEDTLRAAGKAMEGVYGVSVAALPTEDLPGVKEGKELAARYRPGYEVERPYLAGIYLAKVMVEGIRLALEKVGYEGLNRDAIAEGLKSIKGLDVGGLIPPITIDPDYPVICPYFRMVFVEGGKFKVVSDWIRSPTLLKGWKPGE